MNHRIREGVQFDVDGNAGGIEMRLSQLYFSQLPFKVMREIDLRIDVDVRSQGQCSRTRDSLELQSNRCAKFLMHPEVQAEGRAPLDGERHFEFSGHETVLPRLILHGQREQLAGGGEADRGLLAYRVPTETITGTGGHQSRRPGQDLLDGEAFIGRVPWFLLPFVFSLQFATCPFLCVRPANHIQRVSRIRAPSVGE